jgi:uncharacterized protein (TIGR00304 family)
MLEVIGILLIFAGLFLVFKGLTSADTFYQEYEDFDTEETMHPKTVRRYADIEDELYPDEQYEYGKQKRAKVRGGGVILIGPIPIVFGDSKYAFWLVLLTIILMLLSLLIMFSGNI